MSSDPGAERDVPIEHEVQIAASPAAVWHALTEPSLMRLWMGEPEMQLRVVADWRVGGSIEIRGVHHGAFVDRGRVLAVEPCHLLRYTHRSSISRLPDVPESDCILELRLAPRGGGTALGLTIRNFPTLSIRKHLDFYWRVTLGVLARFVEAR